MLDRRCDGSAPGVPQYHDKPSTQRCCRVLNASYLGRLDYVSSNPNYKQIPKALVEDNLGWRPGVGATEQDRKRLLSARELTSPGLYADAIVSTVFNETTIAVPQSF
jgi:hypothetical protein